ncbi:protamine-like protein 99C [Drosophila subpulchrella]|uniref:protamine-like protein 99C n=1 Tax=Drosophila subpulchrella TaxID=1486046 RepID=UPI0018A1587D|nr:protamine-like protein 99C [Drosophila subpulchrella]
MDGKTLRKTTGSLNLSTELKKRSYGISPQNGIRFGAREWNYMTLFTKSKETMTVIKSASQEFESQSHGESPGKSELKRESRNQKERKISKSIKRLVKKKPSPVLKIRHKSPLGSAVAYIHYMRKFQSLNSHLSGPELLNKAARVWCVLTESQRKQFDLNLKVYKRSNGFNFLKIV